MREREKADKTRERERERETDRQTDRQTETKTFFIRPGDFNCLLLGLPLFSYSLVSDLY